ncbi:hypothetical protein quinque_009500 [Culex quinquefasciatus]
MLKVTTFVAADSLPQDRQNQLLPKTAAAVPSGWVCPPGAASAYSVAPVPGHGNTAPAADRRRRLLLLEATTIV